MTPNPDKQKFSAAAEIPEDDGERGTHLFFALCTTFVVSFFAWSYFGKLDVVSVALGEVIPSSQVKSIQHVVY